MSISSYGQARSDGPVGYAQPIRFSHTECHHQDQTRTPHGIQTTCMIFAPSTMADHVWQFLYPCVCVCVCVCVCLSVRKRINVLLGIVCVVLFWIPVPFYPFSLFILVFAASDSSVTCGNWLLWEMPKKVHIFFCFPYAMLRSSKRLCSRILCRKHVFDQTTQPSWLPGVSSSSPSSIQAGIWLSSENSNRGRQMCKCANPQFTWQRRVFVAVGSLPVCSTEGVALRIVPVAHLTFWQLLRKRTLRLTLDELLHRYVTNSLLFLVNCLTIAPGRSAVLHTISAIITIEMKSNV